MKLLVLLMIASVAVCAYAREVCEAVPETGGGRPCQNCIQGQKDKLTYLEWKQKNWDRPGQPDGTCPGNRNKRIIAGAYLDPPQEGNKCCCEPVNSPNYPEVNVPSGQPE
ncbi:CLUMA_CG008705, isoform A [Clunio marinus]|uniref:CLUMA_CG008705, isoform A n=1 Tax=Clunio marinus TaxID=568069 RepID=A0A1J1I759_9DIPT|nr:CLUMA_CG008705, isoform A [Clunio marinus]